MQLIYLFVVMVIAGGLGALVLNWRFLIAVGLILLIAQGIYAVVYADLWNFVRTFVALVAFQLGYLLSGVAFEMRRSWLIDKVAGKRRTLDNPNSTD